VSRGGYTREETYEEEKERRGRRRTWTEKDVDGGRRGGE
jgi:hypothetical protein